MSTSNDTQVQTSRPNPENTKRRKRRDRGWGQRAAKSATTPTPLMSGQESAQVPEDEPVCWICAEPVKYYSVSECNHRTCHVCALRLRVLYKRMDCTFCKHPQNTLIFTKSSDSNFESYTPEVIPFKDTKLSIFFETQDMMEETLIFLRYNCPESSCDFRAQGWGDLKIHVRAEHGRSMCDMCIRHKKVFSHEHILYQPSQLSFHLPSIPHRPSQKDQGKIEGGIHPMCEFCHECYFGDDELFTHMRERHEECFLCKRDGVRDQHFKDYYSLERHFDSKHFPCKETQCLARKFVVFGSALDLQAHVVEEHGNSMNPRDKKDARRVETTFLYGSARESVGGNRQHGGRFPRSREREPPDFNPRNLGGRRREGFGAALTAGPSTSQAISQRPHDEIQIFDPTDADPIAAERQAAFIARLNDVTSNSPTALPAIKAAIQSYRISESGPRDLVLTFFNVVDNDLDGTARLISSLVEMLEDEDKRRALLAAWNGFKLEQQRQFPDLVSAAVGSEYAGVTVGRVIKGPAVVRPPSTQSSRQVLDRVAQAAASSSSPTPPNPAIRFDSQYPTLAASKTNSGVHPPRHFTAWSAASSSKPSSQPSSDPGSQSPAPSARGPASLSRPLAPELSAVLFPTLPSGSNNSHPRPVFSGNQSLKNILGDAPSSNPWATKNGESVGSAPTLAEIEDAGKGKKKKGKEKQTLFTIGTFPS